MGTVQKSLLFSLVKDAVDILVRMESEYGFRSEVGIIFNEDSVREIRYHSPLQHFAERMGTDRLSAEKERYKDKQECCRIEVMSLQNNATSLLCLETRYDLSTDSICNY